jgi:predicted Zn-dependent protease
MFLAHTRAEEASADQSSVRYLVSAGINPRGAVEVQTLFRGQEALSARRQDPYVRSHPLTRDRLRALQGFVAAYGKDLPADPTADYWFARTQGKLSAFLRAPGWTLRRADSSISKDIVLIRKAVAYHKQSNVRKALQHIDNAIKIRPSDPFMLELKGQILLESRRFQDAVIIYGKAVKLSGNQPLILGGYGRALSAAGRYKQALPVLEKARSRDFRDGRILRDLAVAYARQGQNGMASVVTAERYALQGRLKDAALHAKRAAALLPQGSGPWRRAQDVLNAAQQAQKKR